jgi:lipid A 3-O-deacylase
MLKKVRTSLVATAFVLAAAPAVSFAVDGVSFEVGTGNSTQIARVGAQWRWDQQWFKSNGTHLGGYWDLSLSQWRGNRYQDRDATQNITVIGITPVFRFQNDSLKGFYVEGGVGANLMSELYNNGGNQMSTSFEFGDHIGLGYVFQNKLDIGLRLQHYSNGGIKHPNDGVNFAVLRAAYQF